MNVVENWLDRIGLGYSIPKFREFDISTPEQLLSLRENDFDRLGVTILNHKKSLSGLINKVKMAYQSDIESNTNNNNNMNEEEEFEDEYSANNRNYAMGRNRTPDTAYIKKKPIKTHTSKNRPKKMAKYQPKIQVVVRIRPLSYKEQTRGATNVLQAMNEKVTVREPKEKVDLTKYVEKHEYIYDQAFGPNITTEDIYECTAKLLIDGVFEGSKATCFAYGQTGSGKTFTMLGGNEQEQRLGNQGIYLLAAQDIFSKLDDPDYNHLSLMASFYEIYGGKIFDLLNNRKKLRHLEDAKKNVQIVDLKTQLVDDIDSLLHLIMAGNEARSMGSTGANADSSRSHAVLQLSLVEGPRYKEHGRFSFIDLAGSERGADTGNSDKSTRIEGAEINKSLLALKECIRAMYNTNSYTPFRGSTLTQVLKESFIGNCSTLMIATVSPSSENVEHTLNTLRYAYRVKEINGPACAQEENIARNAIKRGKFQKTSRNYDQEEDDYMEVEKDDDLIDGDDDPEVDYNDDAEEIGHIYYPSINKHNNNNYIEGDSSFNELDETPLINEEEMLISNINNKLSATQVLQTRVTNNNFTESNNKSSNHLNDLISLKTEYINMHSSQMDQLLTIINDEMILIKNLENTQSLTDMGEYINDIEGLIDRKIDILSDLKARLDTLRVS